MGTVPSGTANNAAILRWEHDQKWGHAKTRVLEFSTRGCHLEFPYQKPSQRMPHAQ